MSPVCFPVAALIVSLGLISCGSTDGGGGGGTPSTTTTTLPVSHLDSSFGTGGIVTTPITTITTTDANAYAVAIQDGKIVTAGLSYSYNSSFTVLTSVFALARYNTDGSLDPTFGSGGVVTTAIGHTDDTAQAVVIQTDGKIVAAGETDTSTSDTPAHQFALVRYNTDGTLDTTFNPTGLVPGIVTTPIGTDAGIFGLVLQGGKLVAVGVSDDHFAVVRYNADGSLDTTFNSTGIVTTSIGVSDRANAVVIQSNKIVVAGDTSNGTDHDFALVRYNTDGSLDTTFNPSGTVPGIVTTDIAGFDDVAYAVAIQGGKIVAAGETDQNRTLYVFAVIRYNADGSLDTTFNPAGDVSGTPGIVMTAVGPYYAAARGMDIQANGRIVVAGYSSVNSSFLFDFGVVRYNTNGSLDSTFGTGGIVTTGIGSGSALPRAVLIQPNGRIVVAGEAKPNGAEYDFAVVRYLP
jgi:uncharacterized delta-60 repeat protein